MVQHLKHLQRLGIYPIDVQSRNYRAGLLLDFSVAMTRPHYLLKIQPKWRRERYKRESLLAFDEMIKDAGIDTKEKALPLPNIEYMKKLRERAEKPKTVIRLGQPPTGQL